MVNIDGVVYSANVDLHCMLCGGIAEGRFCCKGCEKIYWFLNSTISRENSKFSHLSSYSGTTLSFYLKGLVDSSSCIACIQVVEKLPGVLPGVELASLDLSRSIVDIKISSKEKETFSLVAQALDKMGFEPRPLINDESSRLLKKDSREALLRLGISAFSSSNIMIFSLTEYLSQFFGESYGIRMKILFSWISFGLSLPVIFYSAAPLFKKSFTSIKNFALSIDVPIVIAISSAFLVSLHSLSIRKYDSTYFDSITFLIFLLTGSRFLLFRVQQKVSTTEALLGFFVPKISLVDGEIRSVAIGERFPADGVIVRGNSLVDRSALTGESDLEEVNSGDLVFAGTVNKKEPLEIKVLKTGENTRLGSVLKFARESADKRSASNKFIDTVSQYWSAAIISVALIAALFFYLEGISFLNIFQRLLTLFIVTCPCGLAIVAPFTFTYALSTLARKGVIIRTAKAFQVLSRISNVVLDKTGTLTEKGEKLKNDVVKTIKKLKDNGINVYICSGDSEQKVKKIAEDCGVLSKNVFFNQMPEDKVNTVSYLKNVLMVGDGANDAAAMAAADVSISVQGSVEECLKVSDIYISKPGISAVADALLFSRWSEKTLKAVLFFNIFYNSFGAIAALTGHVSPVFAAILMPTSAVTSLFIAWAGIRMGAKI